jgi:hypothetical protein
LQLQHGSRSSRRTEILLLLLGGVHRKEGRKAPPRGGEKSRGCSQDVVRPAQFPHLAPQLGELAW